MENSTLMQTTDEYWRYYGLVQEIFFDKSHITVSILLGIVVFLSLVGNILVIVTSIFYVRLRSLTNISILNLALSDLLFTVGLPFWVCDYIWHLDLGDALCKVYKFFCSVGFYSNVVFLVLMSVQHYIAMLHSFSGWNQELSFADVLICSWVISILAALPVIVHVNANHSIGGCMYSNNIAFVAIALKKDYCFCLRFFVHGFLLHQDSEKIFKSTPNQGHRTTGLGFTLVASYFVFWAPYYILTFLYILSDYPILRDLTLKWTHFYYSWYICCILVLTRCCLNPLIYGLFGLKFPKTAREIFQRRGTPNAAQMGIGEVRSDSDVNLNN